MDQLDKKVLGNATSAYLMLFISGLFLFNKDNKYLNNDFVKNHTKRALTIHLGFLITYIIFISNGIGKTINILGMQLNNMIAASIFIILLGFLVFGIYKTRKGETYTFSELTKEKKIKLLDVSGDGKITERDKLTIILSYIPLIGFLNYAQYRSKDVIQNSTRLNIFITIILILLQIFNHGNLVLILSLIYIIFIIFIGINLFSRNELIQITLPKVFSPEYKHSFQYALIIYFKNYFNDNNSIDFKEALNKIIENKKANELKENELLTHSPHPSATSFNNKGKLVEKIKFLIYIPVINLIFLFFKNTIFKYHIKNGITISLLIIGLIVLNKYGYFYNDLLIFFTIPILFGISYLNNNRLAYKMPYIYDIYNIFNKVISVFKRNTKKVNNLRKTEKEIRLEVKN